MNSTEKERKKKDSPSEAESAYEMNNAENRETILFCNSNIKAPSFTQLHQKRKRALLPRTLPNLLPPKPSPNAILENYFEL